LKHEKWKSFTSEDNEKILFSMICLVLKV